MFMVLLSPTAQLSGAIPVLHTAMISSHVLSAKLSRYRGIFMLCVPITMLCAAFTPFFADVTLHAPASGSSSVHTPSVPAVPVTVLAPFTAVTAAPAEVVTTSFGVMPVWIA